MIGFRAPTIAPRTTEQCRAFKSINSMAKDATAAYLTILPQMLARFLALSSDDRRTLEERAEVALESEGIHQRVLAGYGNMLFFIEEVKIPLCYVIKVFLPFGELFEYTGL